MFCTVGVAVTASHNPAEWNALKLIGPDGTFLTGDEVDEVTAVFEEDAFAYRRFDQLGGVISMS